MAEEHYQVPRSCYDEVDGILYFARLCDKARLKAKGALHPDYHGNMGKAMDLWTCQFLGVDYEALAAQIHAGKSDEECMQWAKENGVDRSDFELTWWQTYMTTRGFRDDLSERLAERKVESGFGDRDEIQTFMQYIEADEGRL